jgi:hypothetical protein
MKLLIVYFSLASFPSLNTGREMTGWAIQMRLAFCFWPEPTNNDPGCNNVTGQNCGADEPAATRDTEWLLLYFKVREFCDSPRRVVTCLLSG